MSETLDHGQKHDKRVIEKTMRKARNRLIQAAILCLVFMIAEIVAGYIANSLAILTDAAHMLSDLCSFLISLLAIWISTFQGTTRLSFGFHRVEILGAMTSILCIWGLTIWLLYKSVMRLIHPESVNGLIMIITAIFGILTNVVMAKILHHDHHHGLGGHDHHHAHQHHHHEHLHAHIEEGRSARHFHRRHTHTESASPLHAFGSREMDFGSEEFTTKSTPTTMVETHAHSGENLHDAFVTRPSISSNVAEVFAAESLAGRTMHTTINLVEEYSQAKNADDSSSKLSDVYEEISSGEHHHGADDEINVRAAYIHALGDLLQNVAVLIAGMIVYFQPTWTIADPICTIIFSVIVLFTTVSILKDTVFVLMEATPSGVDANALHNDIMRIEGVVDVHDVHIWSLSVGKPTLACHVVISDPTQAQRILNTSTRLVQQKYKILHTTIQIDFSANNGACDTDAHAKCH